MAVWRVLHNQATAADWELFDQTGHEQTLGWVAEILLANGVGAANIDRELGWWLDELRKVPS